MVFDSPEEFAVSLSPGYYKFQLWGASGGNAPDSEAGKGGFISGTTKLFQQINAFVFVGGQGNSDSNNCDSSIHETYHNLSGGFNGGGHTWTAFWGGSGGGSSDIRFHNDSLTERVIVAGGGGGAAFSSRGGDGGYPHGTDASIHTAFHERSLGISGKQVTGGELKDCSLSYCIETSSTYVHENGFPNSIGSFGIGGNAIGRNCGGGAGGGGWFGGAGNYNAGGGGGGSSYIKQSFRLLSHETGSNTGNGKVIISFLSQINFTCKKSPFKISFFVTVLIFILRS